jgi:hypothetical protein
VIEIVVALDSGSGLSDHCIIQQDGDKIYKSQQGWDISFSSSWSSCWVFLDLILCFVGSEQTIKLQQLPFWKLNSPFLFFSFMKFVKTDFLEDEGHLQFVVIFYNIFLESTSYCYWKTN